MWLGVLIWIIGLCSIIYGINTNNYNSIVGGGVIYIGILIVFYIDSIIENMEEKKGE